MPRARLLPCKELGCPQVQYAPRCTKHQQARTRHEHATTPTKVGLTWTERNRRKDAVDAHRATLGEWCPGYKREAHPLIASDGGLTADHITPVSDSNQTGPLRVICASCNARKGNR